MSKLETKEELLNQICDGCHWTFVCMQEELDEHCDECNIAELVEELVNEE